MNSELAEKTGLSESTIEKLHKVFAQCQQIEKVLIYGSRAKGNYRAGSDIDLTILGSEITFLQQMYIESQIDDLLLPYTVDLSQYRKIENQEFRDHIDRIGFLFYEANSGSQCPKT